MRQHTILIINFDDEDNEWLSEDKFDDIKIINEYNQRIFRAEQPEQFQPIEKKKRGRKPKVKPAIIPLAPVTIIAIINYILSLLVLSVRAQDNSNTTHLIKNSIENNTIHIEGKFKYCDVKTNEIIDLYEPCRNRDESKAKFPELIHEVQGE